MGYFGISDYYRPIPELDHWLRRSIRMCTGSSGAGAQSHSPAEVSGDTDSKRPENYRIDPTGLISSIVRLCGNSAAMASGVLAEGRYSKRWLR
ncbi:hypothetical protein [Thiorhodococcus drewsii]|uniref:hypothetical protein n=1 Tax=Thiorhodococcus drewsii TaxID=210408 RepID=UPI003CCAB281